MANHFFIDKRPHNGLTYKEYIELMENEIVNMDAESLTSVELNEYEIKKLNLHRSRRIEKYYRVSSELKSEIQKIDSLQIWMVITENWCGDSAQNIPYFNKMAELNPNIYLKLILRDSNLDIMDQYLTNGTRSIPVLVAFDEDGNELFKWGPRPRELMDLIKVWKSDSCTKHELLEKIHLWYGRNRGKNIEAEFIKMIQESLITNHF